MKKKSVTNQTTIAMTPHHAEQVDQPGDVTALAAELAPLFHELQQLQREALAVLAPEVEAILRSRTPNARRIERALDQLLDLCALDEAVHLFRRLCRHYFPINPAATASYVHAYREYWDSNSQPPADAPGEDAE